MKIKFLKNYRNFLKDEVYVIPHNKVSYWVGLNGTGKTTLTSVILSLIKDKNSKIVPENLYLSLPVENNIAEIEDFEQFTGVSFISPKNRATQMIDMDALLSMGVGRLWASEGQDSQANLVSLVKHINDPNHLFILDEIDGHLDYKSKLIFFTGFLKKVKGTVIVISHDTLFLRSEQVFDFDDKKDKMGRDYYINHELAINQVTRQKNESLNK